MKTLGTLLPGRTHGRLDFRQCRGQPGFALRPPQGPGSRSGGGGGGGGGARRVATRPGGRRSSRSSFRFRCQFEAPPPPPLKPRCLKEVRGGRAWPLGLEEGGPRPAPASPSARGRFRTAAWARACGGAVRRAPAGTSRACWASPPDCPGGGSPKDRGGPQPLPPGSEEEKTRLRRSGWLGVSSRLCRLVAGVTESPRPACLGRGARSALC